MTVLTEFARDPKLVTSLMNTAIKAWSAMSNGRRKTRFKCAEETSS
jgi:hypothetical protein